ncbi:hypothetical protein H5410_060791 [Solanum commersonii]|uniref:Uncharacterized protein n=1 Tax=Solanum commersonii TaxID=4109 RepID=A0A9J5W6E7_SOLCO|nr:hypothetical protein H5410_060791 [Solanum commersonii]
MAMGAWDINGDANSKQRATLVDIEGNGDGKESGSQKGCLHDVSGEEK